MNRLNQDVNRINEDAKIISAYLGSNCPKLELSKTTNEGLTLKNKTIIGIKNGYNRRLLIHELLHTYGFKHTYPSNFFSANVNDYGLVDFVLKECFEDDDT